MPTTLPAKSAIPSVFESIEQKIILADSEIESHLKAVSVAGLQKIKDALAASATLPFGLEPYKEYVESFLSDSLVLAQLAAQLGLISAVPVTPPAA